MKTIVQDNRSLNAMSKTIGSSAARNDYGWISLDLFSNLRAKAITQAFPTGELWGINSQIFGKKSLETFHQQQPAIAFGAIAAEKIFVTSLREYISVATSRIGFRPPFVVEFGAVNLKGVYLLAPHEDFTNGHLYGPIRDDFLMRRYDLDAVDDPAIDAILRHFFNELYDLVEISRSGTLNDRHVITHGIPARK